MPLTIAYLSHLAMAEHAAQLICSTIFVIHLFIHCVVIHLSNTVDIAVDSHCLDDPLCSCLPDSKQQTSQILTPLPLNIVRREVHPHPINLEQWQWKWQWKWRPSISVRHCFLSSSVAQRFYSNFHYFPFDLIFMAIWNDVFYWIRLDVCFYSLFSGNFYSYFNVFSSSSFNV